MRPKRFQQAYHIKRALAALEELYTIHMGVKDAMASRLKYSRLLKLIIESMVVTSI